MINTKSQKFWSVPGLLILAALLVATVAISNALFKGVRFDLTENKLYTMTDGTRNILRNIDEPINLYFYFSETTSTQLSEVRAYAKRVREMLEEYELRSGGKIRLHIIDPLPFSEAEDEAAQAGLQPVPISSAGDTLYFGLVGTNSLDDQSTIPFFQAQKETFLEYDLTKLVHSLANPKKTVVGLMSGLPLRGSFNQATGQQTPPWTIVEQIEQIFEVRNIPTSVTAIDDDIDVLMIVHPKALSADTHFGIEQFMLSGGRALIFVDPHADADQPPTDPNDPASMFQSRGSNLDALFSQWGIEFTGAQFVADSLLALGVRGAGGQTLRHFGYLGVPGETLNQDDVVTADLGSINIAYAGSLGVKDGATITFEPMLVSSADSGLLDAQSLLFTQDPGSLQDSFAADAQTHTLAARFSGAVSSAFPDRVTATDGAKSEGEITAIVIADTDILQDTFWVRSQNFFGRRSSSAFASNGDLVFNALDNLTGSSDLISIRGRESYLRPFRRVEALKVQADEQFRQTEERLQSELAATEQRLGDLQASRADQGSMMMTPEQKAEIDSFLAEKARIRKELRDVRRDLDQDIKQLGGRLKAINIVAVPLILIAFALFRQRRRNRVIS